MTYRRGKALAGYLYLPRKNRDSVHHSKETAQSLVVDYAEDGRPIGIEIVDPAGASFERINELLAELHQRALAKEELAPLLAG